MDSWWDWVGVYLDHGMSLFHGQFWDRASTDCVEMVLVTVCLIFKWIHQALFLSDEQKIRKRRTFKPRAIPGKYKNYYKTEINQKEELVYKARNIWIIPMICILSRKTWFFWQELESVKAVLDIRSEQLKRLRKELELMKRERSEPRQEDKETQTTDHIQQSQDQRGR